MERVGTRGGPNSAAHATPSVAHACFEAAAKAGTYR